MASKEEIQKKNIEESNVALAEAINLTSQLADVMKNVVAETKNRGELDKSSLDLARQAVKLTRDLSSEYESMAAVQKDIVKNQTSQQGIEKQILAISQNLNKTEKDAISNFKQKNEAVDKSKQLLSQVLDNQKKGIKVSKDELTYYQNRVDKSEEELSISGGLLSNQAEQVIFLQAQNEELEKNAQYLAEMERRQENLTKASGKFTKGLETVKSVLDKLGLSKISQAMGIDDAIKSSKDFAYELTNGGKNSLTAVGKLKVAFKGLGTAIKVALGPMAILGLLVTQFNKFKEKAKEGQQYMARLGDDTKTFGASLGVSQNVANKMYGSITSIGRSMGMTRDQATGAGKAIYESLGGVETLSDKTMKNFVKLSVHGGVAAETLGKMRTMAKLTGEDAGVVTENVAKTAQEQIKGLKLNVSMKNLMKGVADTSNAVKLSFGGSATALTGAVAKAKKLGLEMKDVEDIAGSLLNIEDSLAAEMEAELLTGKELNLEKARAAALNNDNVGLMEAMAEQGITAAEYTGMNRIQQESMAKALGMNRDSLADMLVTQKENTAENTNQVDMQKQGIEAMTTMASLADKLANMEEDRLASQTKGVDEMTKFEEAMLNLQIAAQPLLDTIFIPMLDVLGKITQKVADTINYFTTGKGTLDGWGIALTSIAGLIATIRLGQIAINAAKSIYLGYQKVSEAYDKVKKSFFIFQLQYYVKEGAMMLKNAAIQAGSFLKAVGIAAMRAISSLAAIPVVGIGLGIAAAAGVAALAATYMNDGVQGPVGGGGYSRTMYGPEGAISFNDKDTIVAGTNLGGDSNKGGNSGGGNDAVISELRIATSLLQQLLNKEGGVYIDGNKVGATIALTNYQQQ